MEGKTTSGIMVTMLLICMLTLAFNGQTVGVSGTIYIRADGSVEGTDKITSVDNVTYTFTDNIFDSIVVERDNIIIDGAGYTVQGTEASESKGIYLSSRTNVTIKNMEIEAFEYGVYLYRSWNDSIVGNDITANKGYGIWLRQSWNNSIVGNNITANKGGGILLFDSSKINSIIGNDITANKGYGIELSDSSNNMLRGNSMANNTYNFGVLGFLNFSDYVNDVDVSNTVDGKPVYYWINRQDAAVPPDAGYVALVNCTRITVQNLNLANNIQGVLLARTTNSTITKNNMTNNGDGILFEWSSKYNRIVGNNIKNSGNGISLSSSSNNSIIRNNITANNHYGILFLDSSNNTIYHNNFVNNTNQADAYNSVNVWDDGYPFGGNYWSNYNGIDSNRDGIGDTPYVINHSADGNNTDNYPLMGMLYSYDVSYVQPGLTVTMVSNSTVSDFAVAVWIEHPEIRLIIFKIRGETGLGFCRLCIPKDLMPPPYVVIIDGGQTPVMYYNGTLFDNGTHRWIYFTYPHSEHEVTILPEFPKAALLPLFIVLTVLAAIFRKRKNLKTVK